MEILYTVGNDFRVVAFDATVKELHAGSASATEHVVEKGAAVVDHVRPERKRLSVEAQVTNTPTIPLGVDGADGSVQAVTLTETGAVLADGARVDSSGQVTKAAWEQSSINRRASVLQFPKAFDRVRAVLDRLTQLMDDGVELTIITGIRQYDSMVIIDLGAPRDSRSRDAITFTMELAEIRFAETQRVTAPKPKQTRGKKTVNKGAQATTPVDKDKTSLAAKAFESFTGMGLIHAK